MSGSVGSAYYSIRNVKRNTVQKFSGSKEKHEKLEPMLRWCVTTGLAAGPSLTEAVLKGALEIIERDAFMISYLRFISPSRLDIENLAKHNEQIKVVLNKLKRYNLKLDLLKLPTDAPVYAIAAVITDKTGIGPAVTVGAKADFNLTECVLGATGEALVNRPNIRGKWAVGKTISNHRQLDKEGRLLYWSEPNNRKKLDFFISGELNTPDTTKWSLATTNTTERLKILVDYFSHTKQEFCYVKLSNRQLEQAGFWVIKAVVPTMHPLHLHESIPYHYSERLFSVPKKLKLETTDKINTEPHPFP